MYVTCAEGHFLCAHISVLILVIWNKCYSPSLLIFWCSESGGGDGMVARERHRQGTGQFVLRLFLPQVFIESLLCPRQCTPCHYTHGTCIVLSEIDGKQRKNIGTAWHSAGSVRHCGGALCWTGRGGELHIYSGCLQSLSSFQGRLSKKCG